MTIVPDLPWRHQTYRRDPDEWARAKLEARAYLVETARRRSVITYTELLEQIISTSLPKKGNAFSNAIGLLLGQVNADESDRLGKKMMLSAVVVNDGLHPGPGFEGLAKQLKWKEDWPYWLALVWHQYGGGTTTR